MGGTLKGVVRSSDLVGRWGGEEFIVVLVNVDRPKLCAASERLLQLVRSSRLDLPGGSLTVTVSVGATLARNEEQPMDTVRRADQLMYRSKRAGRDRVTVDADL